MNAQSYYQRVIDRLKNCYQFSHFLIAAGNEIADEALDPVFPAIAQPVDNLEKLTVQRGSPFMRCIRSPFSLHKKNQEKHGQRFTRYVPRSRFQLDPGFFEISVRRKGQFLGENLQRGCALEYRPIECLAAYT
jgi:hypothetical protein